MKMCNLNYIRKSPFFKVGTPLFSLANVISSQLAGSVQKQLPFVSIPTLFGNIAKSPPSTTTRTRAHTLRAHTRRAHAVSTMQEPREPRDQEARDQAAALTAEGLGLRNVLPETIERYLGIVATSSESAPAPRPLSRPFPSVHFTDSFLPPSATAPPPSATALYHPSASHSSYVPTCCTSASFLAANSPTHPPAWGQRLFSLHHPGRRPCSLRPLLRPQPSPLSIRLIRCHYTKITQIRSFGKTPFGFTDLLISNVITCYYTSLIC